MKLAMSTCSDWVGPAVGSTLLTLVDRNGDAVGRQLYAVDQHVAERAPRPRSSQP